MINLKTSQFQKKNKNIQKTLEKKKDNLSIVIEKEPHELRHHPSFHEEFPSFHEEFHPYTIITETLNINKKIEIAQQKENELSKLRFQYIDKELQDIKEIITKKRKTDKVILPLREAATNQIYYHLMTQKRKTHEKLLAYCRFRVAITLLWSTGLRVNEIRLMKKDEIEHIIKHKEFQIFQPKVNKYRPLLFTPKAIDQLVAIKHDIEVVYRNNEYLSGNIRCDSWISFINRRLDEKTKELSGNIKSHSFRINYATSLLKHAPIEKVANLIGHRDIRTTLMYNRFIINKKEAMNYLEKAIDEKSELENEREKSYL